MRQYEKKNFLSLRSRTSKHATEYELVHRPSSATSQRSFFPKQIMTIFILPVTFSMHP